jgi:hypothetical protein
MHYISGGQAYRRTHVMYATVPIPSWIYRASTVPKFSSVRSCREDLVGGIAILGLYSFPCSVSNKNGVLHPGTIGCTTGRIPKRTFNYLTSHLVSEWRSSVAPLCHSILCLLRGRMAAPKLHTGMRTIARARIVGMWGSPSKPARPAAPMSTQACLMHEPHLIANGRSTPWMNHPCTHRRSCG